MAPPFEANIPSLRDGGVKPANNTADKPANNTARHKKGGQADEKNCGHSCQRSCLPLSKQSDRQIRLWRAIVLFGVIGLAHRSACGGEPRSSG